MDISVVVPVYNNADSLVGLVDGIDKALHSLKFEMVFVDDCSDDDSFKVIQNLSATNQLIRCLSLPENLGQHRATLEGIKMASGNKIAVMDADLQDNPELLKAFYESALLSDHAVFAIRKGVYQSKGRMITSVIMKKIIQLLTGLHFKAGSFYLFDKSIKARVIELGSNCSYPYMSIIVAHAASELKYVETGRSKSVGPSGYTLFKRMQAAWKAIYCSLYCIYAK